MPDALWAGLREGCGTCSFGSPSDTGVQVSCRRYPPVLLTIQHRNRNNDMNYIETEQQRPWMDAHDWCGEYKRKPGEASLPD